MTVYCVVDCVLIVWYPSDPGQVLCGVLPWLPVQAAVLTRVGVRSAQFGASQQPHSIFTVQRVQRVAAGNHRSKVSRGQRSEEVRDQRRPEVSRGQRSKVKGDQQWSKVRCRQRYSKVRGQQ